MRTRLRERAAGIEVVISELENIESVDELHSRYSLLRRQGKLMPATSDQAIALAAVALSRTTGLRPYPVQIAAAVALTSGFAAELGTGEGKTIVGFLAACGFATGGKVHVATANPYLAARDQQLLSTSYQALGLQSVATASSDGDRVQVYANDVLYATLGTIGVDLLTDRFVTDPTLIACRQRWALIVDEADAVLLDDALTPISLVKRIRSTSLTLEVARAVDTLSAADVVVEGANVLLTDSGNLRLATAFGVDTVWGHHRLAGQIMAALRARFTMRRDREYLVRDGLIVMLNERTGRADSSRRTSGGIHEALEAREMVLGESVTSFGSVVLKDSTPVSELVATYSHIGAMSGTLTTDAGEIEQRYGLKVASFGPHRPSKRTVLPDLVHADDDARARYVAQQAIVYANNANAVLVVAASLPAAERVADVITDHGHAPVLITAKNTGDEAEAFAQAGIPRRITVTTAIAGRGVDIVPGNGDDLDRSLVINAGGLVVLGVGHFASERLDRQLIGRCARQGDPGIVQFHVALDDDTVDLPEVLRGSIRGTLADGPVEIGKLNAVGRRITIAQATYDDVLRASRGRTTQVDLPLRGQRATFQAYRHALLVADRSTLVRLAVQTSLRGTRNAAERIEALISDVDAKLSGTLQEGYAANIVDSALRQLVLNVVDEHWATHLARAEITNTETSLASLTQLDSSVEHRRKLTDLFDAFVAGLGQQLEHALAGLSVTVSEDRKIQISLAY